MGRLSAFSYSASRYLYSHSKTPESIQANHLFREARTLVLTPFVNEIPILPFEYEYRFTEDEDEYEKNQGYELTATIIPDGPISGFASESLEPIMTPPPSTRSWTRASSIRRASRGDRHKPLPTQPQIPAPKVPLWEEDKPPKPKTC